MWLACVLRANSISLLLQWRIFTRSSFSLSLSHKTYVTDDIFSLFLMYKPKISIRSFITGAAVCFNVRTMFPYAYRIESPALTNCMYWTAVPCVEMTPTPNIPTKYSIKIGSIWSIIFDSLCPNAHTRWNFTFTLHRKHQNTWPEHPQQKNVGKFPFTLHLILFTFPHSVHRYIYNVSNSLSGNEWLWERTHNLSFSSIFARSMTFCQCIYSSKRHTYNTWANTTTSYHSHLVIVKAIVSYAFLV